MCNIGGIRRPAAACGRIFPTTFSGCPYVTCRYVSCVADTGVLDEKISFLEARPVKPDEESYYDLPNKSEESATLYQHCVRAIERGLKFGEHGLPLMGCGDWNDGMNLVGKDGRGESVWLAFFLYDVLTQFAELARSRNDPAFADRCDARRSNCKKHRAARVGRRMVSPRLLRQRRTARLRHQSRMSD
jgi:cyclic beta-1,2-glucan synthetase